jgi:hypothetical protein
VKSEALRRQFRGGAWAILAALSPTIECLAGDVVSGQNASPARVVAAKAVNRVSAQPNRSAGSSNDRPRSTASSTPWNAEKLKGRSLFNRKQTQGIPILSRPERVRAQSPSIVDGKAPASRLTAVSEDSGIPLPDRSDMGAQSSEPVREKTAEASALSRIPMPIRRKAFSAAFAPVPAPAPVTAPAPAPAPIATPSAPTLPPEPAPGQTVTIPPAQEVELKPEASPVTEPKPEATPAPEPKPETTPAPEPKPETTPAPEPVPVAPPAKELKPEVTPAPEPKPEVTPATDPMPEVTPAVEPKLEATPSPEPTPEVTPAVEPKLEATPSPEPKPEVTPAAEPKPEVTPAAEPKLEATPTPEPKPEFKPAPEANPSVITVPEANPTIIPMPVPRPVATPVPTPVPVMTSATAAVAPAPAMVAAPAPVASPTPAPAPAQIRENANDKSVERTGCTTCGGFHSGLDGPGACATFGGGCADGSCIPGRKPCDSPVVNCDTLLGQFCTNIYQMICCPDPCYQPVWDPAANAAFTVDYARPRTVTRIRYDNLNDMTLPDRNQYFFKSMPISPKNFQPNGYPFPLRSNPSARLQQGYLYQEAAGAMGSFFIEMPYRQVNPLFSPTTAGFSDLNFGIKSLMVDTEMLQATFQFKTYTPTGNAMANLGTGHVSLEPSLLLALKLTPTTFFQGQFGNWIPLGGQSGQAGGVFLSNMSLNQVLCELTPTSPLIGTLEMDVWSFENGGFTRPVATPGLPAIHSSGGGVSYFNIGPGLRQSICNKVDFGGVVTFATTGNHWGNPWFRFEVRFLF